MYMSNYSYDEEDYSTPLYYIVEFDLNKVLNLAKKDVMSISEIPLFYLKEDSTYFYFNQFLHGDPLCRKIKEHKIPKENINTIFTICEKTTLNFEKYTSLIERKYLYHCKKEIKRMGLLKLEEYYLDVKKALELFKGI